MQRKIHHKLVEWKNNPHHKPLVLLGARQVGKTYVLKDFGQMEFFLPSLYVRLRLTPREGRRTPTHFNLWLGWCTF